jgi:hypothetical protein
MLQKLISVRNFTSSHFSVLKSINNFFSFNYSNFGTVVGFLVKDLKYKKR